LDEISVERDDLRACVAHEGPLRRGHAPCIPRIQRVAGSETRAIPSTPRRVDEYSDGMGGPPRTLRWRCRWSIHLADGRWSSRRQWLWRCPFCPPFLRLALLRAAPASSGAVPKRAARRDRRHGRIAISVHPKLTLTVNGVPSIPSLQRSVRDHMIREPQDPPCSRLGGR
jgi:hypothetical protein